MNIEQRVNAFDTLGKFLHNLSADEFQTLAEKARNENPWFTEQNVRMALHGIQQFLSREALKAWIAQYILPSHSKTVALVMAGNIPLVGFHDLLTVLLAGHTVQIKLSSKDKTLMMQLISKLIELEPGFKERITIVEQLKNFDAVIATGSDNAARYFDYYFGKYPNIIRKNRTSVAILDGTETTEELTALGKDIFTYFGLGCRNVSKIFVPVGYTFDDLFQSWTPYDSVIHHHKYCNNYDYQKSILLVNRVPFLDAGFVMLQQSDKIVSPISVVYYEEYKDEEDLKNKIQIVRDKIQVIVGKTGLSTVKFSKAQLPGLMDYADNVDTMQFLCGSW